MMGNPISEAPVKLLNVGHAAFVLARRRPQARAAGITLFYYPPPGTHLA